MIQHFFFNIILDKAVLKRQTAITQRVRTEYFKALAEGRDYRARLATGRLPYLVIGGSLH